MYWQTGPNMLLVDFSVPQLNDCLRGRWKWRTWIWRTWKCRTCFRCLNRPIGLHGIDFDLAVLPSNRLLLRFRECSRSKSKLKTIRLCSDDHSSESDDDEAEDKPSDTASSATETESTDSYWQRLSGCPICRTDIHGYACVGLYNWSPPSPPPFPSPTQLSPNVVCLITFYAPSYCHVQQIVLCYTCVGVQWENPISPHKVSKACSFWKALPPDSHSGCWPWTTSGNSFPQTFNLPAHF